MLKKAKDKELLQGTYIFGKPVIQNNYHSTNSTCLDLMAIRFLKPKNLEIVTFDITIKNNPPEIKDKVVKAFKLIN